MCMFGIQRRFVYSPFQRPLTRPCLCLLEKNLYVATVAGFTGADPLIYREPLRTEQFNPKHLNGN